MKTIVKIAFAALAGIAMVGCSPTTTEDASSETGTVKAGDAKVVSLQVSGMK